MIKDVQNFLKKISLQLLLSIFMVIVIEKFQIFISFYFFDDTEFITVLLYLTLQLQLVKDIQINFCKCVLITSVKFPFPKYSYLGHNCD